MFSGARGRSRYVPDDFSPAATSSHSELQKSLGASAIVGESRHLRTSNAIVWRALLRGARAAFMARNLQRVRCGNRRAEEMLAWTVVFLILAIIAAVLGFSGIAGAATSIAQVLFFVFLILLVVSAIAGALRGKAQRVNR
jgi:uncharacterized membrane protein YtjA (UPF0391 family)